MFCPVLRPMRIDLHAAHGIDDRLARIYAVLLLVGGGGLPLVHRLAFLLDCKYQVRSSNPLRKLERPMAAYSALRARLLSTVVTTNLRAPLLSSRCR